MTSEVNTYINNSKNYPDEKMFGIKKNKMFVFYNMDHYSKDNRDFMVRVIIDEMIAKYHFSYSVEFIGAEVNKVVVKKVREKSSLSGLRLSQIKANRMLIDILSSGPTSPKI